MSARLSVYERGAREQIREWKNPKPGWFGQSMREIAWPVDGLGTIIRKATGTIKKASDKAGLNYVVNQALAGTVSLLSDVAACAVRRDTVYAKFRREGYDVHRHKDISRLDLEQVDAVVAWLDTKYKGLAFAEGMAAGATGLPGLIADIPTLIALNLRAIAEYATYYGFDVGSQRERLFAMHVLGLASSPSDAAKAGVMAQLAKIAADAAGKKAWKDLEKNVLVQVIQKIARTLSIRLTKVKLAQVAPVLGAATGGGFNAYYTARVCDAAYHLYRERFLAEKYGTDVIDLTDRPVAGEGFEPHYPEASEDFPSESR